MPEKTTAMADVEKRHRGIREESASPVQQESNDQDLAGRNILPPSQLPSNNVVNSTCSNLASSDDESSDPSVCSRLKKVLHIENRFPNLSYSHELDPIIRSLDEYPQGYGKLAAIEDCDPSFLIYRKFGWLRNRVLLHHQDELVEYEDQLERLDNFHKQNDPLNLISRRRDEAIKGSRRRELLSQIEKKLAAYDELLLRHQQIYSIKPPTRRNQNSLYNTVHNTGSVATSERDWIRCRGDLAALAQGDGWLNEFVEHTFLRVSRTLTTYIFRTKEQSIRSGNELIDLLSHDRLNRLIQIILTILATVLLLVPVFILFAIQSSGIYQILVIFAFTLAFSACCSIFTEARRQEVFAATAAYCTVLVVFLGNTQNGRVFP